MKNGHVPYLLRILLASLLGVAYSKHIVQIYSYHGGNIQNHLEVCFIHVSEYVPTVYYFFFCSDLYFS